MVFRNNSYLQQDGIEVNDFYNWRPVEGVREIKNLAKNDKTSHLGPDGQYI